MKRNKEVLELSELIREATAAVKRLDAGTRYGKKVVKKNVPVHGCRVRAHFRGAHIREVYVPVPAKRLAKRTDQFKAIVKEMAAREKPAKRKYGFNDIAVCKTIRYLVGVPGEVKRHAIAEVIDVANGAPLKVTRTSTTIINAFVWADMPSGHMFWERLHDRQVRNTQVKS